MVYVVIFSTQMMFYLFLKLLQTQTVINKVNVLHIIII